jgi:transglutaminase-like putative cysteine protease
VPDRAIGADRIAWLALAQALVVAPHLTRVPAWTGGFFGLAVLWALAGLYRGVPLPGRVVRALITVAAVGGVYLQYRTVLGRGAGVAVLVALAGMKLMETRTLRDGFVGVLLGYFLIVTNFLYSESIPTALYMMLVVVAMTAALIGMQVPGQAPSYPRRVCLAALLLAQALPLAVALFLLFPRLPGPLWRLPQDAYGAVSGLSDSMSPGNISSLSLSEEVAFRVMFDGPPPPPARLYWRGPVLSRTDGRTWRAGAADGQRAPRVQPTGAEVGYTVTLERHDRHWLFLLDAPTTVPEHARLRHDLLTVARTPVRQRLRYSARSAPQYRLIDPPEAHHQEALDLPAGAHPRARELAAGWVREQPAPADLVRRALGHFREQAFVYTLTPPLLAGDPVDGFLFETRRGFCEHYAAAFTVLMRSAGVPARVVTGYQGGEVNPLDGYVTVRQSDAHAWAEVWLPKQGWVRVDPTAAVAPARVERGLASAIPRAQAPLLGLEVVAGLYEAWRQVRFGWDAVHNWWNQWVLGYSAQRQASLLGRFGMDPRNWADLASGLALLGGASLLLVALLLWRRADRRPDPAARCYRRFCHKLARRGLPRRPEEGPLDYAARAAAALPGRTDEIWAITQDYVGLRYAGRGGTPPELCRAVRAFRP